jgi:endonuclease YncB( thermonuclease family)
VKSLNSSANQKGWLLDWHSQKNRQAKSLRNHVSDQRLRPKKSMVAVHCICWAARVHAIRSKTPECQGRRVSYCRRVIDGDTLALDNGERIRLIGVNTPETKHPKKPVEHFGQEAAAYTKRIVEGKPIRLEFDPANAPRGHRDQTPQRRTLAYVFLENG